MSGEKVWVMISALCEAKLAHFPEEQYNKCIANCPPQIHNNPMKDEAPFDSPAYKNYKALVDKEREQIDASGLTEYLYRLGYKIDNVLSKIISQLDTVLKDEFDADKVTCSIDDKQVDCNTWDEEDLHA